MNQKIDLVSLQAALTAREKLPVRYAAMIALQAVNEFDPRLTEAVNAWADGTLTADFALEDCSLQDIMDDTGASLFEAICMMDLQIRHPERIEQAVWVLRGDDVHGIV